MDNISYSLPSNSTLKVHEYFKTRGSDAWSFSLFVDELSGNSMSPMSKKRFAEAINNYKASIRVIIRDFNTPHNIQKKLGRQIKELKGVKFHDYYQENNKRPLPSPHINVEGDNNNITNIKKLPNFELLHLQIA